MNFGDVLVAAMICLGVWAFAHSVRHERPRVEPVGYPVESLRTPDTAAYAPQGLLWIDETLEQTTWWGDGAIIQSTH